MEEGKKQRNGQKKKDKRTNNYLQTTTQKTKDRTTRIPLKNREVLDYNRPLSL